MSDMGIPITEQKQAIKPCVKCGSTDRAPRRATGNLGDCKACKAVAYKAWYEANRERRVATSKAWKKANREREAATYKAWREANQERRAATYKAWKKANRDCYLGNLTARDAKRQERGNWASVAMLINHMENKGESR